MNNYNKKKSEFFSISRFMGKGSALPRIPYRVTQHYRDRARDFGDMLSWWATLLDAQCSFHLGLILHRSRHSPLWKARVNRMHVWHFLRNEGKHVYFLPWLPKTGTYCNLDSSQKKDLSSWRLADSFFHFHEFSPASWFWPRFCSPLEI